MKNCEFPESLIEILIIPRFLIFVVYISYKKLQRTRNGNKVSGRILISHHMKCPSNKGMIFLPYRGEKLKSIKIQRKAQKLSFLSLISTISHTTIQKEQQSEFQES